MKEETICCMGGEGRRDERRKGTMAGESGEGKRRRGKVVVKSEKICLAVLSQTHTAAHTHMHTQGCNSLFNYM